MHDEICKKAWREFPLTPIRDLEVRMGSVSSSLNPGVADLLQTLTNVNSPVLSSPAVVSALEKAPASDIVQLSAEAAQLQNIDGLFGISSASNSSLSGMDALFGITPTPTSSTNSVSQPLQSTGATVSPADQAANDQAATQSLLAQGLFGAGTDNTLGALLNTLG